MCRTAALATFTLHCKSSTSVDALVYAEYWEYLRDRLLLHLDQQRPADDAGTLSASVHTLVCGALAGLLARMDERTGISLGLGSARSHVATHARSELYPRVTVHDEPL